jgi:putative proteasome-type protease
VTYCVAIKTKYGLVALSDGRITAGNQVSSARKATLFGEGTNRFFIMTSGLRSIRDKAVAYFQQEMERQPGGFATMLDTVSAYTQQLRRVELEDRKYVERSDISFNLHTIIGGMMEGDKEPRVFLVYPEGNWIEMEEMTPHLTIGATSYGKPILDRTINYHETDLRTAVKIAYLSFDSTKFSSSDVGFPIDIITMSITDRHWREAHLENSAVRDLREWWNSNIKELVAKSPDGAWLSKLVP